MLAATSAWGQGKVTRIVVAFPAGGPVDFVARTIAEQLGKELDGQVIVDNKPGGNGVIAAQNVSQSTADGTTLWLTSVGAAAINPVLYETLAYDMQRDFAPVARVVDNDEVLVVNASNPAKDAAEFVANAKASSQPAAFRISRWSSSPTRRKRISCTYLTKGRRPQSPTSWVDRSPHSSATFRD